MVHTIETFLPVFSGFYGTFPGAILEDQEAAEMDMNPSLTVDNVVFDHEQCRIDISQQFVGEIEQRLKRDFKVFTKITYESLYSPREYNFKNDSINCTIKIHKSSIDRIICYLVNNIDNWATFLEDCYPNYSVWAATHSFINPFTNKRTKVTVWQTEAGTVNFTVRAGANSDFSYTGLCEGCESLTAGIAYVNDLYNAGKLFR